MIPRWRPNVLGIAVYLFPGIAGAFFLSGFQIPRGLTDATSSTWVRALSVMMIAGSALGIFGAIRARWRVRSGLIAEAIGTFLLAGMFTAYVLSISAPNPTTGTRAWITIAVVSCLAVGCLARTIQALTEVAAARQSALAEVAAARRSVDLYMSGRLDG